MSEGTTRTFKVIGHRGAAGHAPENTFAAFDRGLQLGVDGVETDIRATRDGVLVLLHDATVDRTTDGSGAIAELLWADVRELDAGARFRAGLHPFGRQGVPRLEDFLDRYGGRTTFRLELKARGVEGAALRQVRARRMMEQVVFTSFQAPAIGAIRVAAPEAQTALLSSADAFDGAVLEAALAVGANEVAPRAALVTPEGLHLAREAGLRVWAWGVRDRDVLRQAVAAGIGGCTLDYPDWAGAVAQRGARRGEQELVVGNPQYDLLIAGGTVIDPGGARSGPADVAILGGKVAAVGDLAGQSTRRTVDASGLLVTPGLIDLHAHIYPGCTSLSVDPDPLAARSGTTTMVDCGSVGAATFGGFRRYVADTSRCRVLAFVNISVIGLVAMPECGYGRFVDSNAAGACAEANRDLVVGIKVRGSRNAFGEDNTAQPVWMAVAAGGMAGIPVMLHIGDPPPVLEQALEILRPGDLVTHAFKGQPVTRLVDHKGQVKPAVRRARERGVLFDIGHGSGSFSWEVSRLLAEQGFWPDTISTDVHTSSIKEPIAIDMPGTMTRLLHLGMGLDEVIAASTWRAAQAIGWDDRIGALRPGMAGDVALLALEEGEFRFTDSYRQSVVARRRPVARHTICAGEVLTAPATPATG